MPLETVRYFLTITSSGANPEVYIYNTLTEAVEELGYFISMGYTATIKEVTPEQAKLIKFSDEEINL